MQKLTFVKTLPSQSSVIDPTYRRSIIIFIFNNMRRNKFNALFFYFPTLIDIWESVENIDEGCSISGSSTKGGKSF